MVSLPILSSLFDLNVPPVYYSALSLKFSQEGQNVLPQKVEAGHFDLSRQDIKLRQDI